MEMTDSEIRDWLHSMDIYDYDICDGVVHVVGGVDLHGKRLTSIPVQFGYVSGDFSCGNNKLNTLEGCPSEVGGRVYCRNNNLESLKGAPCEVGGDFYCHNNKFEDKPDTSGIKIGGEFVWV
jgi:hypothetical protein